MSAATDLMLQAIEALQSEMDDYRDLAAAAEEQHRVAVDVRNALTGLALQAQEHYERRLRAMNRFNADAERIRKHARRLVELSKDPLPVDFHPCSEMKLAVRGKRDIEFAVKAAAQPVEALRPVTGIYFLLLDEQIVYIGQSTQVFERVLAHSRDPRKTFNRACYIAVPTAELDDIEAALIALFRPVQNVRGVSHHNEDSLGIFQFGETTGEGGSA